MFKNPCHFTDALDAELFSTVIGCGQQDLDADLRAHRGAFTAQDQGPIQGYVEGEAAFRMVDAIVPVKNDGQLQPVADGCPTFKSWRSLHQG